MRQFLLADSLAGQLSSPRKTYFGSARGEIKNWRLQTARRQRLLSQGSLYLSIILVGLILAIGAWQRRWIADDGLIVLRTVRNLLAGNGPVFNKGERVEVNTSTTWTYTIWFIAFLTHVRLEYISLFTALILGVAAIMIATYATGKLLVNYHVICVLPLGAMMYIAIPPARDFTTSGLEVSSVLFWIAVLWALSLGWIRRGYKSSTRYVLFYSFWIGLGVLVRPDLALVSTSLLILLFFRIPRWIRKFFLLAASAFLPICYEFFRMGYYGLPVPNTAIAKDANGNKWSQGFTYLFDLIIPYKLWIGVVILCIFGISLWFTNKRYIPEQKTSPYIHHRTRRLPTAYEITYPISGDMYATRGIKGKIANMRYRFRFPTIPTLTKMVAVFELSGLLQCIYWIRQGGDFMHGRVLLPGIFTILLPVMCVPVHLRSLKNRKIQTFWKLLAATMTIWLLWLLYAGSVPPTALIADSGIVDERQFYAINTAHEHPITIDDYADYMRMRQLRDFIAENPAGGVYFVAPDYDRWLYSPYLPGFAPAARKAKNTVYYLNLGMPGMITSLDVRVIDQMGLAYPIAAHTDRLVDGRIGHDKNLLPDWVVAQYHVHLLPGMDYYWVYQAHEALECAATKGLIDSYSAELTWARFKQNLKYSFAYMNYRIDRIPRYSDQLCGLIPKEPPK